jgi:thymidylate synthase (FAD)
MRDTEEQFVTTVVDWIGYSTIREEGLNDYLERSGNEEFKESITAARAEGISDAEILCSFFAKLCYKALTLGQNTNISRTRDIASNLIACFDHGHGSVFEHVDFSFVISDCSRVFTHELVRHRIGTAFSQNSGRYCRLDQIPLVWDPILDPVKEMWSDHLHATEDVVYLTECALGLRKAPQGYPHILPGQCLKAHDTEKTRWVVDNSFDFTKRKKITSAIRRIAPNGQANEIGFTTNLRTLRHTILMRTGRHAEWEIRVVFEQIYLALKEKYPYIFYGAVETVVDGIIEVSGMKMQPYEQSAEMVLAEMSREQIQAYLDTRPEE